MKKLNLQYVAAVYPITRKLGEFYETDACTIGDLIRELDGKYGGFSEMFLDTAASVLTLNTMIYYGEIGSVPRGVLKPDQPILDGATITFW